MVIASTLAIIALASEPTVPILPDLPVITQADTLPRRGSLGVAFSGLPAEEATKFKLNPGEGLVVTTIVPGLTGEKLKLQVGDIILSSKLGNVTVPKINQLVRETPTGQNITFNINRKGENLTVSAPLVEKPRDPGTANYEVIYSHVVANGQRMRTIITKPKRAGKHPGFFFIQGFSPVSYDYTLATSTGNVQTIDGPILHHFAENGYVTVRVEKPGVGDSEGGPFADLDFNNEIDIYRQALLQLKSQPEVDTNNVFIFGHSMGASFGPIVASEIPVKGIAIFGGACRTWFEYLLDTIRYQGLVGGATFEQADQEARIGAQIMALVMIEKKSPAEVKVSHPQLAPYLDAYFPGGLFNGKTLEFWRQLQEINFPSYWTKTNAHVLSVKGESDFVVYEADHKLIADIINRKNPGFGTFKICPDTDHLFHNFDTEPDSLRGWQRGTFNNNFTIMLDEWINSIRKK
ncbi:hypothetical protein C0431_09000 [bacterium]|nr:hypothetical protein [bacterium]